jgi:predicted MFS family arabinose efflux permease
MAIGTLFSLGVFLKPIEEGMGWSRSSIGAISLLNWVVMGIGSLAWGALSDRFGARVVVLWGGAILGLGLVLSAQAVQLWHFYLAFGVLVGAGVSAFYVPLTVIAIKWFEGQRGLAAAVVSSGNGFGILVLSPLSRALIDTIGWRGALVVLGDLAWLIVIPVALLLRDAPGAPAPAPAARGAASQALRGWPFWAIALTHFACCSAHSGPIFHLVSYATDRGVAQMAAAAMLGISGLSSIAGRVVTGIVADRVGAKRTLVTMLVFQAALIVPYLAARDVAAFYGLAAAFGIAYGGVMPLYALVTREYFGERVMGTAYGAVFFISSIGMGIGSWAGGAFHDFLGSYQGLFLSSAAVGALAVLVALGLRPPARTPSPAA